jgi:hypothetical protein
MGILQFALLFFLPHLSMLGYAANIRVGAITYNAVHTYVGPLVLAGYAFGNRALPSLSRLCNLGGEDRAIPPRAFSLNWLGTLRQKTRAAIFSPASCHSAPQ